MSECMERNPYNDDEQNEEKFDPEEYMECSQIDLPEEQRRRRLDDGPTVPTTADNSTLDSSPMKPVPWRPLTLSLRICSALISVGYAESGRSLLDRDQTAFYSPFT